MGPKLHAAKIYTNGASEDDLAKYTEPSYAYTDGSKELKKALEDLGWCHDTSTLTALKPMGSRSEQYDG